MTHKQIYEKFKEFFPVTVEKELVSWLPFTKNSIRVFLKGLNSYVNGYIFTFISSNEWDLRPTYYAGAIGVLNGYDYNTKVLKKPNSKQKGE